MRKLFFMLCSVLLSCNMANAQTIVDGVLKSWDGAEGEITIPDNVTEIAPNCFYEEGEPDDEGWGMTDPVSNTAITGVNLNNVTKIGDNAFRGCTGIRHIEAPKLREVGEEAFSGCSALMGIDLPAIVTIGKNAFANCDAATAIKLGNTLENIVRNPFKSCKAATELTMPDEGRISRLYRTRCCARLTRRSWLSPAEERKYRSMPTRAMRWARMLSITTRRSGR